MLHINVVISYQLLISHIIFHINVHCHTINSKWKGDAGVGNRSHWYHKSRYTCSHSQNPVLIIIIIVTVTITIDAPDQISRHSVHCTPDCYVMIRSGWSHYQTQLILIIDYKTISETRPSINWKQKRSAYFAQIPASLILDIFPCYFYHLVLMSLFFFFKYWHPCAGELPPWGNTLFIQAQCTDKTNCTAFETKGNTRKLTSV